ncbi:MULTISPECIES: type III secretion system export apparatus subunit SctR [Mesorhizobium]|uniref:Type III secretion apparatus protein RhcR n=1 Tax=Mesorhizobium qingshengii TaxID=1165689 RepID=A0A1G5ZXX9_9HYPH|nr:MULTISPECIES: type III secretion system export apparatus subunit SctR [Mesorhizobium]MCH4561132.1 type III secretion system export apparatus subunit SctR [Mesorhizobium jarvisii]QGU21251.1 EscR/YscR/HrcR family type III secretion system export apparatus protein [Mesorhizobium huakuii 7653R]SDA99644.1 type III secretion apparatus protein RhcR [Mesorhizobium qingshengii]
MTEVQPTILALLAVTAGLGLLVLAVVTTTAFVKVSVVLFLVRNALGTQTIPPNIVLYAVSLILTMFVSAPVIQLTYDRMSDPKLHYQTFDDWVSAVKSGSEPLRDHLKKFTNEDQRKIFLSSIEKVWPEEMRAKTADDDLSILVPSFLLSELKRAFEIGFLLYLPFIVIDLIVTTILMAMGMSMVSPTLISVPFKLFVFVSIDGWSKLMEGLVLSYTLPGG